MKFPDAIHGAVISALANARARIARAYGYIVVDTRRLAGCTVLIGLVTGFVLGLAVAPDPESQTVTVAAATPPAAEAPVVSPRELTSVELDRPVEMPPRAQSVPVRSDPISPPRPQAPAPVLAAIPAAPAPTPAASRPQIAIVLDDVGINGALAAQAIALDSFVTLAFLPYAPNVESTVEQARAAGHEIMLHLPMEPLEGPANPGPNALTTAMDTAELADEFNRALAQVRQPVGFNNHMGSKMTASRPHMVAVMAEARRHGLMFLDSRTTADTVAEQIADELGLAHAARDVFLDNDRAPAKIAAQLATVEDIARRHGRAIAIGHPYPETLDQLSIWIAGARSRGFDLVPVSELATPPAPKIAAPTSG